MIDTKLIQNSVNKKPNGVSPLGHQNHYAIKTYDLIKI